MVWKQGVLAAALGVAAANGPVLDTLAYPGPKVIEPAFEPGPLVVEAPAEPPAEDAAEQQRRRYLALVDRASRTYGVDAALVQAVIMSESSYDPKALSPAGAGGLMQLMPGTAERYGVKDPFDPEQNVRGGVRHLKDLLEQFDGNVKLAVAAYNAGAGAVIRAGMSVPRNSETEHYVPRVMDHYRRYREAS